MEDYLNVLKHEFDAEDDSFLIQLRCDFSWDKAAFERLTNAMKVCCEKNQENQQLERWLAQGFWFVQSFVRGHISHPNFPKPYSSKYYEKACERLENLADYFFFGELPHLTGQDFEPLEDTSKIKSFEK